MGFPMSRFRDIFNFEMICASIILFSVIRLFHGIKIKNYISNVERHEVKLELKPNVCQKLEKI